MGVVGKNIPHDSAVAHVTGESLFIDDMPPALGEVLVDFVGSPVAHGRVRRIDLEAAKRAPGIVGAFYISGRAGAQHLWASRPRRSRAGRRVDPLCRRAGRAAGGRDSRGVARREEAGALSTSSRSSRSSRSTRRERPRASLARAQRNRLRRSGCGARDAPSRLSKACCRSPVRSISILRRKRRSPIPEERGGLTVYSSTQHPSEVQAVVAEVCGLPFHRVTCICRRMGGGFGGKETQAAHVAAMAAMAAILTKRPARVVLNRDDDMAITGKRHRFQSYYKVGFTREGLITALLVDHFSDGGCSTDLSLAVLERAMMHTDNALLSAERADHRPRVPHELPVEHGVSRVRRAAGSGGHRKHHRRDRPGDRPRRGRHSPAQLLRRSSGEHDAVRPNRREQHAAATDRPHSRDIGLRPSPRRDCCAQRRRSRLTCAGWR